jgi:hypothetical protein
MLSERTEAGWEKSPEAGSAEDGGRLRFPGPEQDRDRAARGGCYAEHTHGSIGNAAGCAVCGNGHRPGWIGARTRCWSRPAVVPAPMEYGPPVCDWGYYSYYPYACAPYGYYGPNWFYDGVSSAWGRGTAGAGAAVGTAVAAGGAAAGGAAVGVTAAGVGIATTAMVAVGAEDYWGRTSMPVTVA